MDSLSVSVVAGAEKGIPVIVSAGHGGSSAVDDFGLAKHSGSELGISHAHARGYCDWRVE